MYVLARLRQAPGDEDDRCTVDHPNPQVYPDTVRNLMDSYNYEQLLPGNGTGNPPIEGAVWNDRSYDGNDEINRNSPTFVSMTHCVYKLIHVSESR